MRILLVVGLALALAAPVSAHTGTRKQASDAIVRSQYGEICGAGPYRECRFAARATLTNREDGHWWRFTDGYFEEWHTHRGHRRLFACSIPVGRVAVGVRDRPRRGHRPFAVVVPEGAGWLWPYHVDCWRV